MYQIQRNFQPEEITAELNFIWLNLEEKKWKLLNDSKSHKIDLMFYSIPGLFLKCDNQSTVSQFLCRFCLLERLIGSLLIQFDLEGFEIQGRRF